jgi:O-antigen ligase
MSVSRGALLGTALGVTIALRRLLKRGFIPLLTFVILGGFLYNFGVFDRLTANYEARGTEETGRLLVWLPALERLFNSPLVGVGGAEVNTYMLGRYKRIPPHNSFIYLGLAAGVVPLAFFIAWWIRAARNAVQYDQRAPDDPFRLPLLVFALVESMLGDLGFMVPWGLLTFTVLTAPNRPYGLRRVLVREVRKRQPMRTGDLSIEAGPPIAHPPL